MPDLEIKQGDTDPDLRGSAADALHDATETAERLDEAEKLEVVLRQGADIISGEVEAINPPEPDPDEPKRLLNWRYKWETGQTDKPGSWVGEMKATWNGKSTPPLVTRYPTHGTVEVLINANQGEPL